MHATRSPYIAARNGKSSRIQDFRFSNVSCFQNNGNFDRIHYTILCETIKPIDRVENVICK